MLYYTHRQKQKQYINNFFRKIRHNRQRNTLLFVSIAVELLRVSSSCFIFTAQKTASEADIGYPVRFITRVYNS